MSDKRSTTLRPRGFIEISGPDAIEHYDTLCCVHCGAHWRVIPGSGRIRGYCETCAGPTCGPGCSQKCVPVEQLYENMENGRPLDYRPIVASVPRSILTS